MTVFNWRNQPRTTTDSAYGNVVTKPLPITFNGMTLSSKLDKPSHQFYVNSDAYKPAAICDRNGAVVLQMCRKCGLAEGELINNPVCTGRREP